MRRQAKTKRKILTDSRCARGLQRKINSRFWSTTSHPFANMPNRLRLALTMFVLLRRVRRRHAGNIRPAPELVQFLSFRKRGYNKIAARLQRGRMAARRPLTVPIGHGARVGVGLIQPIEYHHPYPRRRRGGCPTIQKNPSVSNSASQSPTGSTEGRPSGGNL